MTNTGYKTKHSVRGLLSFRGLVPDFYGEKYSGRQPRMWLECELTSCLYTVNKENEARHGVLKPQGPFLEPYLLQHGHFF